MKQERSSALIRPLLHWVAIACGYGFFGLSFLIVFEILARKLFNFSLQGVDEIGGYVLAVGAASGFGYALFHRSHTRIDLAVSKLGLGGRTALNLLAYLTIAAFAVFMAWRAGATLRQSIEFGSLASTPLQTPLWIPQTLWFVGLLLFAIAAVALTARAVALALQDRSRFNAEFGTVAILEEVEEQMHDLSRKREPPG